MRIVSGLYYFCRHIMATFGLFSPLFEWLWRKLCFFCCCIRRLSAPVLGYSQRLLSIVWPGNDGSGAERNEENPRPANGTSTETVHEVLNEAEARASEQGTESDPLPQEDHFDEFYCEYDSTWESDQGQEGTFRRVRRPAGSRNHMFRRFESAARDMQNYRHDYPIQNTARGWHGHASDDMPNLDFYLGLKPFAPNGVLITTLHDTWFGQYDLLESVHTYIQWLFPLQEPGVNYEASPLTKDEVKEFKENIIAKKNLLISYKLMLDFYGIQLCNEETGEVTRAPNWRSRFNNLNSRTHNNLRITRILKCLGTLGYAHYQAPLVHFFLVETLVHHQLPSVRDSVLNYFVFAVLNKQERRDLIKFAYLHYSHQHEFVWCPKKIQMLWSRQGNPYHLHE